MKTSDFKKLAAFVDIDETETKEIIEDYLFAGRDCSFIYPTELEEDILLLYSSRSVSKKKALKLKTQLPFQLADIDSFFFFAKLLKDSYRFADGIFSDGSRPVTQKKLFTRMESKKEILSSLILKDSDFFHRVIGDKKVLYITAFGEDPMFTSFPNIEVFPVPFETSLPFDTWLEWFDFLKMKVMTIDFDIAFISLDILSDPLNQFIAQTLHKIAFTKGDRNEKNNIIHVD